MEEIKEAAPEKVVKRAEEELEKTRRARVRTESILKQVSQSQRLVDVINRRLFSAEKARPRTLNEIIVNLPTTIFEAGEKNLQEFARGWPAPLNERGVEINREEDEISVENQKKLIRAYLCGFSDPVLDRYQPGYFQAALKLGRSDCPIKL